MKPFREDVVLEDRKVLSPLDKRDHILPVPQVLLKEKAYFGNIKIPIWDQKRSVKCTAFASLRVAYFSLSGAMRDEFVDKYATTEVASYVGSVQFSFVRKDFFKRLLRQMVWRARGQNMRAALWNLNKGVRLPDGSEFRVREYLKCKPATAEDLCRYIQQEGSLFCGLISKGKRRFKNGVYEGRAKGRSWGHAICITGFDAKREEIYFDNSWGDDWGKGGRGIIPFEHWNDLKEVWTIRGAEFEISKK